MPAPTHDRARYRRILRFAAGHLAVTWWYEILLPLIGLRRIAERTRTERLRRFARRFRGLAIELGGLMIKLGQFMSSRLDVLPPEVTKELEGLQDEVPPVDFEQIGALAEDQLGVPLERVFAEVDTDPVAAASLGQAYRARLADADAADMGFADVIVKVQRPGIGGIVAVDIEALRRIARWLARLRFVSKRVDMPALIEEFAATSREEIDYLHEGANAERFDEIFAGNPRVRVPRIVWERTTRQVLTMEDVTAIKISDRAGLSAAGIDPAEVASAFASIMFEQLFEHSFFHADPHPGNLFVTPASPRADAVAGSDGDAHSADGSGWAITFVDFGMMGKVPEHLRSSLRALIIASAARDGAGMVTAMQDAGVLLPGADTDELERVITEVFSRFGGMGFAELREVDEREFREFALEFGDVMLSMPFQMPEDFLLIIRAVSLTSGVCSTLDPAYNVWDTLEPYAQKLLREQGSRFAGDLGREAVQNLGIAWGLPRKVERVLEQIDRGDFKIRTPRLEDAVARAESTVRRLVSALVFAALLVGGAMVRPDEPGLGAALMIGSVVPLAHVVFGRRGPR